PNAVRTTNSSSAHKLPTKQAPAVNASPVFQGLLLAYLNKLDKITNVITTRKCEQEVDEHPLQAGFDSVGDDLGGALLPGPELACCRPRTRCDSASRRRHRSSKMGK